MSTSLSDPIAEADRQQAASDAPAPAESLAAARVSVAGLAASGALDSVGDQIDGGQVQLSGAGGLLPELIKAVLERGLQAELAGHSGYEKGDPAAGLFANSRNGRSDKTVASDVGNVPLQIPRDCDGTFTPRLVPKGQRRVGGLDEMIISLYAGGMTLRDIRHHLASTIGTDLSHETLSKITGECPVFRGHLIAWADSQARRSPHREDPTAGPSSWAAFRAARTCAPSVRLKSHRNSAVDTRQRSTVWCYMFHEFELGKSADILVRQLMVIQGDETLVITADTESDPSVVHAVARSAFSVGAKPMEIWTGTPLQSGKAADGFLPSDALVGALSAADAWLELNKVPILYSRTYERAHEANPKLRHLMLGGMDAAMMTRCIGRTNYAALADLLTEISRRIVASKRLRITSPAGTDIQFENRPDWPMFAVDGRADTPGTHTLGGMMAWAPDFETTHGVIVIDGAVSKIGIDRLGAAITLEIRAGEITGVRGGHEARRYEEWMRSFNHPQMLRLAHSGLGFLPRATLSGIMSEQERIWGCSVWGVGDAAAFLTPPHGFPAPSHNDGICLNCSLWLDDTQVMHEGELVDEALRKLAADL